MNNQKSGGFNGKGYYIALVLCAAAIGISGYLYYRNANQPIQEPDASVSATNQGQQDVPAIATKPAATQPSKATQPTAPTKKALRTAAPLEGETVAEYAMDCLSYNQTTRDWRVHNGVDIAAEAGSAVKAAADGTVTEVYTDDTMGQTVVITHSDGYVTRYASLADNVAVKVGDQVTMGQTIGYVGQSALLESALGDHVHFSVAHNGNATDPADFLKLG